MLFWILLLAVLVILFGYSLIGGLVLILKVVLVVAIIAVLWRIATGRQPRL